MAIVTISNVTKSFGDRTLFENVKFHINERERIALIGANGSGKTTLLRIIAGLETADSGDVMMQPGTKVGYLAQDVDLPGDAGLHLAVLGVTLALYECAKELRTLENLIHSANEEPDAEIGHRYAEAAQRFDTLRGYDLQIRSKAILMGLGFSEADLEARVDTLSGGQKARAALARLLLLEPDLMLLDEPTNHLDIDACEWLQEFLTSGYQGAALIVSHDRYFLDRIVDGVVELENGASLTYTGNYSKFAVQKAARIEQQEKLYKDQQKEIARIEAAIQTLFSDRKFSRRDSKVKQLERIERVERAQSHKTIKASMAPAVRSGREVLRIQGLSKSFQAKVLFEEVSMVVERGSKIGIVGPNGSGKTTFLKVLMGMEPADSGKAEFGHNVKYVYFAQEFDHLRPERAVIEELLADADLPAREARNLLARFLFLGDDVFKKVGVLSGGELCRLALAKIIASKPNLLLLDEPTNHLDIASREAFESALRAYDGTVMVASHDRYLLDAVANEIVEIRNGVLTHHLGNYSAYRKRTRRPEPIEAVASNGRALRPAAKPEPQARARPLSSLRETERALRKLLRDQEKIEDQIAEAEERLRRVTTEMGNEEHYKSNSIKELSAEYENLNALLGDLYESWEAIGIELDVTHRRFQELQPD